MSRSDYGWDWPRQFPNGALHTLEVYPPGSPRLAGLRSVRNLNGGVCRPAEEPEQPAIGFAIPRPKP